MSADAHIAPHDEAQKRFEQALRLFLASNPSGRLSFACKPTCNKFSDRLKKIVTENTFSVRRNAVASEIIQIRGERKNLLDDVMPEMEEVDEKRLNE